ncbi:MAG: hypothetical protein MI974_31160 [Chitinophagales bacterium]|nr:hypothetical protein [Chitinophagales bacterium]
MKTKMTIHRGLAELKLLDARIEKNINLLLPSGIMQEGKLVNDYYKKEEFEKNAKAKFQSIQDLIKRKNLIKSAIVKVNTITEVQIGEKKYTIADAINFKAIIKAKKILVEELTTKHRQAKAKAEEKNKKVDDNALKLAEAALQKDNVKINDGDAIAITEPYVKKNKFHLIDPLNVEELVAKLQEEIDEFETEVDAVLSEINAVTYIEIDE